MNVIVAALLLQLHVKEEFWMKFLHNTNFHYEKSDLL